MKQNGWPVKQLGDVCEFRGGGTPSKQKPSYWKGDIPWVSPKDMKFDVVTDSIDHISPEAIEESTTNLIPKGSVLVVVRSGILARTIPVAITGRDLTINQDIKALCPDRSLDPRFLFYFLKSRLEEMLALASRGATVHRIMADQIRAIQIAIPSLPEQQRIVGILDEAFDGIATAKANAEKNLRNARELFESHVQAVFKQRGDGWRETTIGEQMTFQRGFDITKKHQKAGDVPVVSSGGIKSFHDTAMAKAPGVVIGRKGTLGKVFYIASDYWPHDTTLWIKDFKGNDARFVYHFLRELDVVHLDSGSANPALNRNVLHPIRITWPRAEFQRSIVEVFDKLDAESRRLECVYEQKRAALDALKKSLLHCAFNGALNGHTVIGGLDV